MHFICSFSKNLSILFSISFNPSFGLLSSYAFGQCKIPDLNRGSGLITPAYKAKIDRVIDKKPLLFKKPFKGEPYSKEKRVLPANGRPSVKQYQKQFKNRINYNDKGAPANPLHLARQRSSIEKLQRPDYPIGFNASNKGVPYQGKMP